jgi:competence protein ComEA
VIDDNRTPVSDEIIALNHESTEEIDEQTEIKKEEITGTQITININTVDRDELVLLPNVGPVTAERIIRYQEDYGLFDSIDDLTRVKGTGPKTLEKLKAFVIL